MRAGALGDVLLLRRAVAALRRGGYEVTLLAPAASGRALLGAGPSEVQRLVDWEHADVAALLADGEVRAETLPPDLRRCDLALACTRSEALVRNLRALVPRLVPRDPQPSPGVPAGRWLAAPLEPLGLDAATPPPPCVASPQEEAGAQAFVRRLPRGFLAIHPGSGSAVKNWPATRLLELVDRLQPPEPWLVVCGPADARAAALLRMRAGVVVAEDLAVRVLGAVLARAGVFVGNDSGVSHLAAAWGAPTVALFGPTDARTWAPEGARVRTVQSRSGDMAGIGVGEVIDAVAAVRMT